MKSSQKIRKVDLFCTISEGQMSAKVLPFSVVECGDIHRTDPDEILESAKGCSIETLVVIGELPDGTMMFKANANSGTALILMERVKHCIVFGEDD
jgi:hypothetical protein